MLDELEEILGYTLSGGYGDYSPADDLWRAFATEEEKAEAARRARECMEELRALESPLARRTREYAERTLLKNAEPLLVLKRFCESEEIIKGPHTTVTFKR